MGNIQIINVRPQRTNGGTYVTYSTVLKPTDHTINGSFTASNAETKEAFNNNQGWDGFKQLAIDRIKNDVQKSENK